MRAYCTPTQIRGMKRGARIILARFVPHENLDRPLCLWVLQDPNAPDTAQSLIIAAAENTSIAQDVTERYMLTFDIGDVPYFLFAKEIPQ